MLSQKPCPRCGQPAPTTASRCWSCGHDFDRYVVAGDQTSSFWRRKMIPAMALLCLVAGIVVFCLMRQRHRAIAEAQPGSVRPRAAQPYYIPAPPQSWPQQPAPQPGSTVSPYGGGNAGTPQSSVPAPPATAPAPSAPAGVNPAPALPPEDQPRYNKPQGRAHLGNAKLSFENDGSGHEQCTGRVLVVNDGPYNITDFRLAIKVALGTYSLVPFEGSIDYPRPIYSRHLGPGEQLDCPVMTTGYYSSYSVHGVKSVVLEATLDGPPGVVEDEASVY